MIRTILFLLMTLSAGAELRLLSYNIRHGRGMDDQVDLERTAAVIRAARPDLVALQEVDRKCRRSGGVDQAEELANLLGDGWTHHFGKFMDHDGGEYGLAWLSRLPVRGTTVIPLPAGREPRVALEIEVETPDKGMLRALCVHFDWVADDRQRFAQASALLEAIDGEDADPPMLVAGDFNDRRSSRTLQAFARVFRLPPTAGPTCPSDAPVKEIDFCVYRGIDGAPEIKVIDEKQASDHRPLLLVFP